MPSHLEALIARRPWKIAVAGVLVVLAYAALPSAHAAAQEPLADPAAAFAAAQNDLATELGVAPSEITLARSAPVTWADGCLGLGGPNEACILVLVSGWALWLQAPDAVHRYHTDADGSVLRSAGAVEVTASIDALPLPEGAEAREAGAGPGPAPAPQPAPTGDGGFLKNNATPVIVVVLLVLAAAGAVIVARWVAGRRRAT